MPHGSVSWLVFTLSCPFPKRSVARQLRQTYSGGPAPESHRTSHNIDAAQLKTRRALARRTQTRSFFTVMIKVSIQSFLLRVNLAEALCGARPKRGRLRDNQNVEGGVIPIRV